MGDTTVAAKAMAKRLIDAGLPAQDVQVVVPPGKAKKRNLVARLRGSDSAGKPILLLAHLDVVEAKQEDCDTWLSRRPATHVLKSFGLRTRADLRVDRGLRSVWTL